MDDYDYEISADGSCWADSFYCDCLFRTQRSWDEREKGVGAIRHGEPPRRSLGRSWRDWQRRHRGLECPKSQCRRAAVPTTTGTIVRGNGKIRKGVSAPTVRLDTLPGASVERRSHIVTES